MTREEARGILLAAVMEADHKIGRAEVDFGTHTLGLEIWGPAMLAAHDHKNALKRLLEEPIAERRSVIAELWAMSGADGQLHEGELSLLTHIERALGVEVSGGR